MRLYHAGGLVDEILPWLGKHPGDFDTDAIMDTLVAAVETQLKAATSDEVMLSWGTNTPPVCSAPSGLGEPQIRAAFDNALMTVDRAEIVERCARVPLTTATLKRLRRLDAQHKEGIKQQQKIERDLRLDRLVESAVFSLDPPAVFSRFTHADQREIQDRLSRQRRTNATLFGGTIAGATVLGGATVVWPILLPLVGFVAVGVLLTVGMTAMGWYEAEHAMRELFGPGRRRRRRADWPS